MTGILKSRRALIWAGGVPLGLALAAVVAAGLACTAPPAAGRSAPTGDLAVLTLTGPNRLVTVDLTRMRIVSDVRLRSFVTDLSLDASSGLAVTAQGGGVGQEADDVAGVYDVRGGGPVTYVKLGCPNPGFLTAFGGHAYIEHGMYSADGPDGAKGMVTSVVDLSARAVESTGLVPPGLVSSFAVQDGSIWSLTGEMREGEIETDAAGRPLNTLTAIAPSSLESRWVTGPLSANRVVAAGEQRLYLLEGAAHAVPGGVSEIGTVSGVPVRTVLLPSLPHGAQMGAVAGRWLVVSEWEGSDLGDPGRGIAWVDRATLAVGGTLEVRGGPCAMAGWGDLIVVVERETPRLLVIDPSAGRVVGSVELGGPAPIVADVEVLPEG